MNRIYFAASYSHKAEFFPLYKALKSAGFTVVAPIFDYQSKTNINYKTLMNHAFNTIGGSNLLVADCSYKEIGIGIEAGYAKAQNIPIFYLQLKGTPLSTTVYGTCTKHLVYEANNYSLVIQEITKFFLQAPN